MIAKPDDEWGDRSYVDELVLAPQQRGELVRDRHSLEHRAMRAVHLE